MFKTGPLTIDARIIVPGSAGVPAIAAATLGAVFEVLVIGNRTSNSIDIEVEGAIGGTLLVFAKPSAWPCAGMSIPNTVSPAMPYRMPFGLAKAPGAGIGSETVSCRRLRYRQIGLLGWSTWRYPGASLTAMASVV